MRKTIFTLLLILGWTGSVLANSGSERLDAFLSDLHTLQADFRQTLIDEQSGGQQFASGTFYLSRPGRFRWDYTVPDEQYILADGRSVWLVDEELEQVTQRFQKSALKGTPAQLLAGSARLEDEFTSRDLGERQGIHWLELTPIDEDSQFVRISLGFRDQDLTKLEMTDKFGQMTNFSFSNIKRNTQLDQDLFRFIPPPGYDILDQ